MNPMTPKLDKDLTAAVDASGRKPVEVVHPSTNQTYFVVDGETLRQAMEALRRQHQQEDDDAIAEGIAQMEAGEGISLEEARELSRLRLLARRK